MTPTFTHLRRFPGHSYDQYGSPITDGTSELTQEFLNRFPVRFLVSCEVPSPVSITWILDLPVLTMTQLTPHHLGMAAVEMSRGKAILVVSHLPQPVVHHALFEMAATIGMPSGYLESVR